jgi:hypothetical protein
MYQPSRLPARLKKTRTVAGLPFSTREAVIIAPPFLMLGVLALSRTLPLFVGIGLWVFGTLAAVSLAIFRVHGHFTIEEYILREIAYRNASKHHVKGANSVALPSMAAAARIKRQRATERSKAAWFMIPERFVPSNEALVFYTFSLSILSGFVTWLLTEGRLERLLNLSNHMY